MAENFFAMCDSCSKISDAANRTVPCKANWIDRLLNLKTDLYVAGVSFETPFHKAVEREGFDARQFPFVTNLKHVAEARELLHKKRAEVGW
jgi:hypothetical protein